jgi:P-type E1-E2 ATPase
LLPQKCTVIRDGVEVELLAEMLVPGDIVILRTGVRVPADLRLITVNGLKMETSAITGLIKISFIKDFNFFFR